MNESRISRRNKSSSSSNQRLVLKDQSTAIPRKTKSQKTAANSAAASTHKEGDAKRARILDIALGLFFKNGYAGTTIADIASRLGVTKPFVYYYFENKDDLFETLMWHASEACLTSLESAINQDGAAANRLQHGLQKFAETSLAHYKGASFYYREASTLRPAFQRKMRGLIKTFHTDLTKLLLAAQAEGSANFDHADFIASSIMAIGGFIYTWHKPGGALSHSAVEQQLTRQLLAISGFREEGASSSRRRDRTGLESRKLVMPSRGRSRSSSNVLLS